MTCKDCVHYEVCESLEKNGISRIHPSQCEFFKDKAKFIDLPCKVGDKVFIIGRNNHETYINTGRFRISDIEKIGKKVFFTKEKAEKALEEL